MHNPRAQVAKSNWLDHLGLKKPSSAPLIFAALVHYFTKNVTQAVGHWLHAGAGGNKCQYT